MKAKLLNPILFFLLFTISNAIAQDDSRTKFRPDLQYGERLALAYYEIKNPMGEKVAWETPSFLVPQITFNFNFYNVTFPIDFGFTLPIRKNFAYNYTNLARKDTIMLNRYYQIAPGVHINYKFGDFRENPGPYWVVYAESTYNLNFLGKQKEMTYDYPGFDPLDGEWNILHGIANSWKTGIFGHKFNKTTNTYINMKGGPSVSFGIGKQWSEAGEGLTWAIVATRNFYDTYNKNYTFPDGEKPFADWQELHYFIELKIFYRIPLGENFVVTDQNSQ